MKGHAHAHGLFLTLSIKQQGIKIDPLISGPAMLAVFA